MILDNCVLASGDKCRKAVASPHLIVHMNLGSAPIQLGHKSLPKTFPKQTDSLPKNRASRSRVAANDLDNSGFEEKSLQYAADSGQNYDHQNVSKIMAIDFHEPEIRPKRSLLKKLKRKRKSVYIDKSYAISDSHNSNISMQSNFSAEDKLKHRSAYRNKREENFAGCIQKFRINNEVSRIKV